MPPIISMRPSNQQRANVVAHLEKAVNPCDAVTSSAKRRGGGIRRHFAATGVAFLHSGTVSGMTLVGHTDANRHALLNTRKLPVYSTCRLCQQTQTLNLLVVVQGQCTMGCAADESGMEGGFSAP